MATLKNSLAISYKVKPMTEKFTPEYLLKKKICLQKGVYKNVHNYSELETTPSTGKLKNCGILIQWKTTQQ